MLMAIEAQYNERVEKMKRGQEIYNENIRQSQASEMRQLERGDLTFDFERKENELKDRLKKFSQMVAHDDAEYKKQKAFLHQKSGLSVSKSA